MLKTIFPRKLNGSWVFTDPSKNLENEPLVSGINDMLEQIAGGAEHLAVVFSDIAFPGYTYELLYQFAENYGTWYYCRELRMYGWLCPALLKYFPVPPKQLFIRVTKSPVCKTNPGIVSRLHTWLTNMIPRSLTRFGDRDSVPPLVRKSQERKEAQND